MIHRFDFINLKDSVENLSMRVLSMNSKVPMNKLLSRQMEERDWNSCFEVIEAKKDTALSLYNISANHCLLDKILLTIRESIADLVLIDDLQMIETENRETEKNRYVRDKMDCILKEIKILAIQSAIPIIGTYCIPAKKVNSRVDHRPMITDFEYDSLQQYPDNIQMLYKDDLYNPENVEFANTVEIITVKNILNQCFRTQVAYVNGTYGNIRE